jgi:acyl-CoA dehydrogenase
MNDYTFAPFLEATSTNWYQDDALLAALLAKYTPQAAADAGAELDAWGALCAGELHALSRTSGLVENRPYLRHWDAYNRRVDDVVLPHSTEEALRVVEGRHRMGAVHGDPYVFYAKSYLYQQNGESGVGCSMACTDGMVRVLERLGDRPEHAEAVRRVRESTYERYYHGAQFVTEIQGGSDVPANVLEARPDGDGFRLFGPKWFCSNINADYFVMTARLANGPEGGRGVGLFLVPAFDDEARRVRNGYRIDRLKEKLGTRELATAEVRFEGARAIPIGPLDRGVANVVANVLVTSRYACIAVSCAFLRAAERLAESYARFRTAFGQPIAEFPLVQHDIACVRAARERSLAILFELQRLWLAADASGSMTSQAALDFRLLISMAKPVLTADATQLVHEAIMVHGANGIEEVFSPLPRIWRDAAIMETWEGPHNLLYSQALRDLARFEVEPRAFVTRLAGEGRTDLADELGKLLSQARDLRTTVPFADWTRRFVRAWGDALVEDAGA